MAASTSKFIAGHYTATFNSVDIGTTIGGFNVKWNVYGDDIHIDDFPGPIVDGIYTGKSLMLTFTLARAGVVGVDAIANPWGVANDTTLAGQTYVDFSKALVLTPVAGINSANVAVTFPLSYCHEGPSFVLGNHNLVYPITVIVLPAIATGVLFTPSTGLNRSSA